MYELATIEPRKEPILAAITCMKPILAGAASLLVQFGIKANQRMVIPYAPQNKAPNPANQSMNKKTKMKVKMSKFKL